MKKWKSEVKKGAQLWKQYYWWLAAGQTSKSHCLLICWTFLELKTNKNGFGESEQSGTQPIPWSNKSPKYKITHYLFTHMMTFQIFDHKKTAGYNEWDWGFQAFCTYWSISPYGIKSMYQHRNGMKMIINDRIIIEGELPLYISMLLNHESLKQLDSCAAQCERANYGTQSVWWFISHHDNASWLLSGTHTHDGSHAYCGALEVHPTATRE